MTGRPIRVTHVIETPGPGGAETILTELVSRPVPRRFECDAIVPSAGGWLGKTLPIDRRTTIAPTDGSGIIDRRYLRELRRQFEERRPDVIHAHSFDSALYSALAARGLGVPVAATFHGASDLARRGWRNRIKWTLMGNVRRIVTVSHSLARVAATIPGIDARRLTVVHNGIDLSQFTPNRQGSLRARLGLAPGVFLFGAVGNVRAPKGYDVLLRAVASSRTQGVNVHVAIAGDAAGPLADALRAQRHELGLDTHVTLAGFIDDVPNFLNGLDAFVLPSISEGFSLSTVQALATGLPVVATRSGGPEEIVEHERSGLLVEANDADALASGMESLARDHQLRDRLAQNARARALSTFSVEGMVAAYGALHAALVTG